jgi:hypothetical protein
MIIMGFMFYFLNSIDQSGFGQRFFFISKILFMISAAVCTFEIMRKRKLKLLYVPLAVLFICVIVISPITNLSNYYSGVSWLGQNSNDEQSAAFASTYSIVGQSVTGDQRLLDIVGFFRSDLQNSVLNFQNNVNKGSLVYSSPETEIMVSNSTPLYMTVLGVQDSNTANYIMQLYNNSNLVYSNNFDSIFVPR